MANLSALSAGSMHALRTRLETLEGVERVLVEGDGLWVVVDTEVDPVMVGRAVRAVLAEEGAEAESVQVELMTRLSHQERHRVKFLGVERVMLPEARVRVRVSLEWEGAVHVGEEVGEASAALEMRTAAAAAVKAVQGITPEDLRVRLIGVKQIRAFDQEITVVSLLRETQPAQRLVGAVLTTEDPLPTAALAVLNALNRVLGNYLSTLG